MVSTGQRADCSRAACWTIEKLGERYQGLDQGSGRDWRREDAPGAWRDIDKMWE